MYIDLKFLLLSINIYNNAFVKYKMNRKLQFISDYVIATLKSCIKVYFEYHLKTKKLMQKQNCDLKCNLKCQNCDL